MDDRQRAARSIVATVPQLLGVQVETADTAAADAVAGAIERIAENLLRWHDRLVVGSQSAATPTPADTPSGEDRITPRASAVLRAGVRRGRLPGRPVTLHLAAAELRAVVRRVTDATADLNGPDDGGAGAIVDQCLCLATELDIHADLLQVEGDRLTKAESDEQRDQVLARVMRAEHRLARVAMVTLTP